MEEKGFWWFKFLYEWYSDIQYVPIETRGKILDTLVSVGCGIVPQYLDDIPQENRGWLDRRINIIQQNANKQKALRERQSLGGQKAMSKRWNAGQKHPSSVPYTQKDAVADRNTLQCCAFTDTDAIVSMCQENGIKTANEYFAWCAVFVGYIQANEGERAKTKGSLLKTFGAWLRVLSFSNDSDIRNEFEMILSQYNKDFAIGKQAVCAQIFKDMQKQFFDAKL